MSLTLDLFCVDDDKTRRDLLAAMAFIPPRDRAAIADLVMATINAAMAGVTDTLEAEPNTRVAIAALGPAVGLLASAFFDINRQVPQIAESMGIQPRQILGAAGNA